MLFAFGGNEQSVLAARGSEAVGLLFFPLGILIGMVLGWRHELWGGLVTVGSLVAFYLWHAFSSGGLPTGPYFLLFALPGSLFLPAWCARSCFCQTDTIS
jgi:glucose-6-phosphate-specific signal transduction histidine kinase